MQTFVTNCEQIAFRHHFLCFDKTIDQKHSADGRESIHEISTLPNNPCYGVNVKYHPPQIARQFFAPGLNQGLYLVYPPSSSTNPLTQVNLLYERVTFQYVIPKAKY
jgi:hypothetical protein